MESKIWDKFTSLFELDLPPHLKTLEQHIEFVVPKVQRWSEDLREEKFYLHKRWKEIRDADTYHEIVLHIFMPGGEYLVSIDGDISKGGWRYIKESNTFIVDYGGKSQLFDLVFLNGDFFILKKHGDQARKGRPKYFMYGNEKSTGRLDWRNCMEKMYTPYRENSKFVMWLTIVIIFALFLFVLSINL